MRHPAGTALHRYRFLGHQASGRMTMSNSNNAPRRGDAGLAFIFGGILAGLAIIVFVVLYNGGFGTLDGPEVSVDIDLPRIELPGPPKMPTQPQVIPLQTGLPEPAPPMSGVNRSHPVR
jgi:hypothetical protein